MALLLDTSDLPPGHRADAIDEAIQFSGASTRVVYNCPYDEVAARLEYFTLGEAYVMKSTTSRLGFITTPALLRNAERDLLAVAVKQTGTATLSQAPGRLLGSGDLFVTNQWLPHEYFEDEGQTTGFCIPLDRLGLPRDYAVRASEMVHSSPLAAQLRRHLQILFRDADAISRGPAAATIAQATTDLVRATLISAADEEPFRRDDRDDNLTNVVKSYIAQHLGEPDLGAERIAREMFISVRQLYKLWEIEPGPLGQWIIERRLEAAHRELASPRGRHQTIAAVAGRWGFADSTHFSRRFRQAYGMSPREWRQACHRPASSTALSAAGRGSVHT